MTQGPARIEEFRAELFEPFLGEYLSFVRAEAPDAVPVALKLVDVKRGRKSPLFDREPFSLLFSLKDAPPLEGHLYGLDHPQFESTGLLVTRVFAPKYERLDPDAMFYEIVFT